ncbi:hypothetical protein MPL1032_160206 [Mesorhizobium plurifarium]|uniref:Uncharacterized protein n=1 Tax=Mesorhizobium plurifarium TaxID=69974 RepID=A0A0K2VTR7_MESPL|nr:hypothetical protein MPL1032_160206 [Mesorhizobium plurifarium]
MKRWTALGPFHAGDLVSVHGSVASDRDVLSSHKAFLAEMEADLVVTVTLGIVKIPLPARFAAQAADEIVFAGAEATDTTETLVRFPFFRIQPSLIGEGSQHVVAFLAVTLRMAFFASQKQANGPEVRGDIQQSGHGILLSGNSYRGAWTPP